MSNREEGLLLFGEDDNFSLPPDERKISGLKLMNGTSNASLAKKVAEKLNVAIDKSTVRRFADNELFVEIHENVRGSDAFILQPTSKPANDHLMELLIMTDALRRASARRITAVIPYFGYARQDRKTAARTPISAKLIANLIDRAGVDRVLTLDLHAGQIQGYFDIPVDNLYASPLFGRDIKRRFAADKQVMIVSPDVGGVARAREIATRVGAPLSIVDKRRDKPGSSEVMNVIGNVEGYHCILIDDIIDSGGTICNAAKALLDQGAVSVSAYCTHGVLSNNAVERIENSYLQELTITDSIESTQAVSQSVKVRELSVSSLLAEAIYRTHTDASVSSLFI